MKILIALSLLFSSQVAFSGIELAASCKMEVEKDTFSDLAAIEKHLEWHGADNSQMQKAACKTMQVPTIDEMKNFIASKASLRSTKVTQAANGVSFQDESPVMIELFKNLTTAKDGFGISNDPSNQKNFQKEYSINPDCKKVACAIAKIWGEKLGTKISYINLKHNYNTSEFAFTNSDRLNDEEIDDILMAMEDLPKNLIPVGTPNQRLTHFSRGYKLKNQSERVAANAVVMLFDTWSGEPRFERQYSVFHEMSHNMGTRLSNLDTSPSWLKLSGWIKKGDDWSKGESACFITEYGLTNPFEDFAETMATYRYNPKVLKEKCPEKYKFAKDKVFKGMEYLTDQMCIDIPAAKIQGAAAELSPSIEVALSKLSIDKDLIKSKCAAALSSYPVDEHFSNDCQLELVKDQIRNMNPESLKLILTKNNISADSTKTSQLQTALAESIISSGFKNEKNSAIVSSATRAAEEVFTDIVSEALPKKTETSNGLEGVHNKDFYISTSCRKEIWSGDQASMRKCLSDYLIKDDKVWAGFNSSVFLKKVKFPESIDQKSKEKLKEKYYTELEKTFLETDILDSSFDKSKKDYKDQAKQYFRGKGYEFYKEKSDWKKLEPQEFCAKFYSNPDEYYKKYIFPTDTDGAPGFQKWCEEKQSSKKKRFQFSEEDLNAWVDQALK
jgi:hypothetical protein